MSDGKYGGQYDQHDGNCLVCGRMLNKKNECSLCDSIEAPLLNRIAELEEIAKAAQAVVDIWLDGGSVNVSIRQLATALEADDE